MKDMALQFSEQHAKIPRKLHDYKKAELSLSTHYKHIGGAEAWFHSFLNLALHEEAWSVSAPAALPPVPLTQQPAKAPRWVWTF